MEKNSSIHANAFLSVITSLTPALFYTPKSTGQSPVLHSDNP